MKPVAKKETEAALTKDELELCDKEDKCGKETTYTVLNGVHKDTSLKVLWSCDANVLKIGALSAVSTLILLAPFS